MFYFSFETLPRGETWLFFDGCSLNGSLLEVFCINVHAKLNKFLQMSFTSQIHSSGWHSWIQMWRQSEQLRCLISIPYAKTVQIKAMNTLALKKENNQIMSFKIPQLKRLTGLQVWDLQSKRSNRRKGVCTTFLTFIVRRRGWGNSCAIKDVWPHKLTLNLSLYSLFLISFPSTAWLFPFTSTVSFGIGDGPQTFLRCLRFAHCRI